MREPSPDALFAKLFGLRMGVAQVSGGKRRVMGHDGVPNEATMTASTSSANTSAAPGRIDWERATADLDTHGMAVLPGLLAPEACVALRSRYDEDQLFRSRIVMARHGFGRGEYRYFADPLPEPVRSLRTALYPPLADIANRWNGALGVARRFPADLEAFRAECRAAGQDKPTPLMLRYEAGDYNCLHQDVYGEHVFPLQVAVLLSRPGEEFTGGEFVMTEQRPRMQSRVEVAPLGMGDAVVFPVVERPVTGKRGVYRVKLRHGVSRLRSGLRHTLGVIFHDAR